MDIQQLKIMIDLKALNGMNRTNSTYNQNNQSSFQEIFEEAINSLSRQNDFQNKIGAVRLLHSLQSTDIERFQPSAATNEVPKNLDEIITRAADIYKIPKKLIQSIIQHESNFNPTAVSHAGASGLMQLMPTTAKGLGVTDIFDPEQNVFAGAKYMKQMLDKFNGNIDLALAAYNAGPGNVEKYGGIPPFTETRNYVKKVSSSYYT
ncbi:soluble lytic murein transglycosylase-like protein [Bacillus pakistanensis]|uniref:Soluble lytic murein transglycosylase-like protein n=1 Tax=Rossellomorea pakistanensis TaxID=992288 RepID=A0ABS2NFA3_9BACI|nr:transglycosylase SLT domain-containing protein [Bacillus pakistanensis]MBM7586535.1 soluble lytic murein transglycosylase-like protein [Bacillus pakistanensis]